MWLGGGGDGGGGLATNLVWRWGCIVVDVIWRGVGQEWRGRWGRLRSGFGPLRWWLVGGRHAASGRAHRGRG